MKKYMLCLFLALSCAGHIDAQKVIDNPKYEFRNSGISRIGRIELTKEATKIVLISEFIPGWWVEFTKKLYIEDAVSKQKYHPLDVAGIAWEQQKPTPASGTDTFFFTFPPLPPETVKINWVEDYSRIYGITLDKVEVDGQLPPEIIGNWYGGEASDAWTYGIYEKFAIYANKYWEYGNILTKKRTTTIDLQNGNDRIQLSVTAGKNGEYRIGTNRKKAATYSKIPVATANPIATAATKEFFRPGGKAAIQGYIRGYDPRAGFTSGIIYNGNCIVGEDVPTVVEVHPDGRFETVIDLDFPTINNILFDRLPISFYAEPGDSLMIYVEWEDLLKADRYRNRMFKDFTSLRFMGASAGVNADMAVANARLIRPDLRNIMKWVKQKTPAEFKAERTEIYRHEFAALDDLSREYHFSPKSLGILKSQRFVDQATDLLHFLMYRDNVQDDTSNQALRAPIPTDYYAFLKEMDRNDEKLLIPHEADIFINRLEFSDPLRKAMDLLYVGGHQGRTNVQLNRREWELKDSIAKNDLGLTTDLIYGTIKLRSLKSDLSFLSRMEADSIVTGMAANITHPYLHKKLNDLLEQYCPLQPAQAYSLPEGKATDIFRRIIGPHIGKVIFIDFWATTCGPCCAGIKDMQPLREKYKGQEVVFVYITDEKSSPVADYDNIMKDVEGDKHRISADDYNYLRQLFRFNGIPRYVLLDRKGNVVNDNFRPWAANTEFNRLLKE